MKREIVRRVLWMTVCGAVAMVIILTLTRHDVPFAFAQAGAGSVPDPIGSTNNCSTAAGIPAAAASIGYNHLIFCDDFDSESTIDVLGTGGPDYKWYTHRPLNNLAPSNFSVANSALTLQDDSVRNAWGLSTWDFRTRNGQTFLFGYFEARIDFDPSLRPPGGCPNASCWPSFWALSAQHVADDLGNLNPTPWTEIDFFEAFRGDRGPHYAFFGGTAHVWKYDGVHKGAGVSDFRNVNNTQGTLVDWTKWHIVGCLWTKDRISWYLDGKKIIEEDFSANGVGNPPVMVERAKIPIPNGVFELLNSDRMFAILGSGPQWPMHVDWVRVWR